MKKTIVITGVSQGLGHALANEFHQMGHTVIGCARSAQKLTKLGRSIGCEANFTPVDITDACTVDQWASRVVKEHGVPDLLLNNAALINANVPFWEVSQDEFDAIIDVNIKGLANVTRAFLPSMLKADKGIIINFSSGYGHSTAEGVAPYCCTKFAVEGLTQALAKDLPPSLGAIPLSPGIINTAMLERTLGDYASEYEGAQSWVKKAAPYILKLSPEDSGQSLRVPQ